MSERSNVVIIRDRKADAYFDSYGALAIIPWFRSGPEEASKYIKETSVLTDELLDWQWAEGGGLIDFDNKFALVWGPLNEDTGFEIETEQSLLKKYGSNDDEEEDDEEEDDEEWERSKMAYLHSIKPSWLGWELCFADSGTNAISFYLKKHGFCNISINPNASQSDLTSEIFLPRNIVTDFSENNELELSDSTAEIISKNHFELELNCVHKLSDRAIDYLSQHKGIYLDLKGLKSLSNDAAEFLSNHKGKLYLNDSIEISDAAAKSLSNHKGKINDMDPKEWIESLKNNE